eukprot:scaffold474111_cov29-Prasinocladus_malaysianus.AAC.1
MTLKPRHNAAFSSNKGQYTLRPRWRKECKMTSKHRQEGYGEDAVQKGQLMRFRRKGRRGNAIRLHPTSGGDGHVLMSQNKVTRSPVQSEAVRAVAKQPCPAPVSCSCPPGLARPDKSVLPYTPKTVPHGTAASK